MIDSSVKKLDLIYQTDPSVYDKGCLYLGSVYDTDRLQINNFERIFAILTVGDGPECQVKLDKDKFTLLQLSAYDHPNFRISSLFDIGIAFISENLCKTNVFVHCFAGVSRSSSIFVKMKRNIIQPNNGFINQLKEYDNQLLGEQSKQENTDKKEID